jgi:hypothetical protein
MKSTPLTLLALVVAQACLSASPGKPLAGPMETAIDRARAKVVEMERINPALSGFSKTRPQFSQDEKGLVKAVLEFNFNATPMGKDSTPMAVEKSKPFCCLTVSVWRPNNLPGQPVHTQREYRVGTEKLEGYVTVCCSDDHLAKELRVIFESEMEKAESKTTSEQAADGKPPKAPQTPH